MPSFKSTRALICLQKHFRFFQNQSLNIPPSFPLRVFCSPVRPPIHDVAMDDLKLLIPLPQPASIWLILPL